MLFHKDSIVIDATSRAVWEYVGSPDCWNLFHSNVGECQQVSSQGGRIGSVYTGDSRMGARKAPTRWEIVDLKPGRMIRVTSEVSVTGHASHTATITYELEDLGPKTRVSERVAVNDLGINVFWRAVVWLISRFGRPTGETTLMKLKRILEEPR
jgi:hypothetical protein